ncbi:hypothetical protein DINM_006977 [Dirofilaria immitis]|nr:hypothetical protein [Dirofilaria immitis]
MASSSLTFLDMRDTFLDENLPYHVDIFLSKKIYNPGDIIHGEVIFRLNKNLLTNLITVQLFGSIHIFGLITRQIGNANFRPLAREQKRILVDETTVLWSDEKISDKKSTQLIRERNGNFHGIEIGSHKFEFVFQLPQQGLYTSFDLRNCGGRIRYCINVQCFSYGRLVLKKTLVFPIVCPINPSEFPKAFENEIVTLMLNCPYRNAATCPMKYDKEWFLDTVGVGMDIHKIRDGSTHKYAPKFNVPALVPGFKIAKCMTLEYALKLDIGFDRVTISTGVKQHIVCTLTIPIFIGTSSTMDANVVEKSKFEEAIVSLPNYYDISPPSYDEYLSKLSNYQGNR